MENKDKIFDSLRPGNLRSKASRDKTWAKLTVRYLRDLPRQLKQISTILEVKDYTSIKNCAHRIKGTSGTYRLETIAKAAAQLERVADSENPDAIASAINMVSKLVETETDRFDSGLVSSFDDSERNTNG